MSGRMGLRGRECSPLWNKSHYYKGALIPPAGLCHNVRTTFTAPGSFSHMFGCAARQPATFPDANKPGLAICHPSVFACLFSFPASSRQHAVPLSCHLRTHSSSFHHHLCPFHLGTTMQGVTCCYGLIYTVGNSPLH